MDIGMMELIVKLALLSVMVVLDLLQTVMLVQILRKANQVYVSHV